MIRKIFDNDSYIAITEEVKKIGKEAIEKTGKIKGTIAKKTGYRKVASYSALGIIAGVIIATPVLPTIAALAVIGWRVIFRKKPKGDI